MFISFFVGRWGVGEGGKQPHLVYRFNESEEQSVLPDAARLLAFCFPLGPQEAKDCEYLAPEVGDHEPFSPDHIIPDATRNDMLTLQEFAFCLTDADGSRLHGFCRRSLPWASASSAPRAPQVACIISKHLWAPLFFKLLEITDKLLRVSEAEVSLSLANSSASSGASSGTLSSTPAVAPAPALLPLDSPAGLFLSQLEHTGPPPDLGRILHLRLPQSAMELQPMRRALPAPDGSFLLHCSPRHIDLEVPPGVHVCGSIRHVQCAQTCADGSDAHAHS